MKLKEKIEHFMWELLKNLCVLILCLFVAFQAQGQEDDDLVGNGIYLGVFYGAHWPGGDMIDRFGSNYSLGGNIEFLKSEKWIYGIEGQFHFGDEVKENVFGGLLTTEGHIIGTNSTLADIDIKERAINLFGKFGRIHDLWSEEHLSGLKWTIGAGLFQHRIRLTEAQGTVPFFKDEYKRGYDRLSNGFALTEFIGYQYLDGRGRLNFFLGAEFTQAFTKNRRGLNYNTREVDDENRLDLLFGVKAGFQVTIKRFKNPDEIWY